ncbi:efflux transporter outer membrane subunit [Sphingosinicella sp. BN140058]|uniref:efflux transporter outer membrane subunit n=1 Tax=Sphingosinicella sp. BN140058 TaxID=1892855 RepID=UPI001013732A|nr:efflux transporter outer membrane subunit [Sphingosinicella sp. BN140058]QAY80043.1 efflux transporter outer membrane subunit [Sphingosinicella sp. BN140058]
MAPKRPLRSATLLLLLAGCSMNPQFELPPAPIAAAYPGGAVGTEAPPVNLQWREMFGDPRLQRLIDIALAENRDLRIATLQVREAQAQFRVTRAARWPTGEVQASYTRQRQPSSIAGAGAGLDPDQRPGDGVEFGQFGAQAALTSFEIDLFGRIRSQTQAAFERYLATDEGRRAARIAIIATVAEAYLNERLADEQLRLTGTTLADWRVSLDLTRRLHDAGQVGGPEVAQAEGLVRQAEADQQLRTRDLAQATNALTLAVGSPAPADLPSPVGLMQQPIRTQLAPGLPSDLLLRRPDILQAEHELRAANYDVGAARAAMFPSLSLTGAFGFASLGLTRLFEAANQSWNVSPQLTVPMLQPQAKGALAAAKTRTGIAVATYERAIQTAFREVADALAGRETYEKQRIAQEEAASVARRRVVLTNMRFRAGLESRLDLLDAQRTEYSARQSVLEVKRAELAGGVSLFRALGGGASDHGDPGSDPARERTQGL